MTNKIGNKYWTIFSVSPYKLWLPADNMLTVSDHTDLKPSLEAMKWRLESHDGTRVPVHLHRQAKRHQAIEKGLFRQNLKSQRLARPVKHQMSILATYYNKTKVLRWWTNYGLVRKKFLVANFWDEILTTMSLEWGIPSVRKWKEDQLQPKKACQ